MRYNSKMTIRAMCSILYFRIRRITRTHIIVMLLALVSVLLYMLFHVDPTVVPISVHTFSEKTAGYDVALEYPEFTALPNVFNVHIKTTVLDALKVFKDTSAESEANRHAQNGKGQPAYQYSFKQRFTPEQLSSTVISVVLYTSYFAGGAHGGADIYTFNYDRQKKHEISLDEIFSSVPDYLHRISEFTLSNLKENLRTAGGGHDPDMTMLTQGLAPTQENFSRFTLGSDHTITFYFPAYQVAAYVYGEQKVTMPLSFILSSVSLANR